MHKEVIVIGGGMSGIKAALDLYSAGITNTLILEARDRLGGRLLSVKSPNGYGTYDFGASWFHDALKNPLFDKALELGNADYYFDDGKSVFFSQRSQNVEKWKFEAVTNELAKYVELVYHECKNKKEVTLREICEEYLELKKKLLTPQEVEYVLPVIRMYAEMWLGVTWEKLSGSQSIDFDTHLGRNAFVKSGYYNVFETELNELPSGYRQNNILLDKHVSSIDHRNKNKIKVTTRDGEVFTCNYLICTIPSSLLVLDNPSDECFIKWTPPLPKNLTNSFMHAGSLGKVILEFEECFWPKDVDRFYALANHSPIRNIDPLPWDNPALFINYAAVCGKPSFVILTQDVVSKWVESLDSENKEEKIWDLFKPMLVQISSNPHPPKPKTILHTSWNNDTYARGAYSVPYCGKDFGQCVFTVANGHGRIRFAGAETMNDSSNGCAHGAWFSGRREAEYIINDIKHSKQKSKF